MANTKALIFLAFGIFTALIGSVILVSGGFKSIMIDPNDGPITNTAAPANAGHFQALVLNYPEMFNCETVNDDLYANSNAEYSSFYIATEDIRDAARAYCRWHDGEQAWTFALYLPLTLLILGLGVTALIRQSGFTLGLVGVGLSAVMLAFTLIIVAHYQATSAVPQARNAFTDCENISAADKITTTGIQTTTNADGTVNYVSNTYNGSLQGPSPRRGWVCVEDWDYDSDFFTASNLVYGGAAVSIVAYLSLLIAFAYIVQPMVTPVPAFAKAGFRGADDVDFDSASASEYTYTYSEEEY